MILENGRMFLTNYGVMGTILYSSKMFIARQAKSMFFEIAGAKMYLLCHTQIMLEESLY